MSSEVICQVKSLNALFEFEFIDVDIFDQLLKLLFNLVVHLCRAKSGLLEI